MTAALLEGRQVCTSHLGVILNGPERCVSSPRDRMALQATLVRGPGPGTGTRGRVSLS